MVTENWSTCTHANMFLYPATLTFWTQRQLHQSTCMKLTVCTKFGDSSFNHVWIICGKTYTQTDARVKLWSLTFQSPVQIKKFWIECMMWKCIVLRVMLKRQLWFLRHVVGRGGMENLCMNRNISGIRARGIQRTNTHTLSVDAYRQKWNIISAAVPVPVVTRSRRWVFLVRGCHSWRAPSLYLYK